MIRLAISTLIAWGVLIVVYLTGLHIQLGAHPIWSDQVLLTGAIAGPILAFACMKVPLGLRMALFCFLTLIAAGVAYWGKQQFVASFADDAFAGQMWYFGWHGICAFGVAGMIAGFMRK